MTHQVDSSVYLMSPHLVFFVFLRADPEPPRWHRGRRECGCGQPDGFLYQLKRTHFSLWFKQLCKPACTCYNQLLGGKQRSCETTYCFRMNSYCYYFTLNLFNLKFEVASSSALAPPTGQSWTCIHVYNFRPIHPIFTNKVSLDSLIQAEFNALYVVDLRHAGFSTILVYVKNLQNASPVTDFFQSSRNLAHMTVRPCLIKNIER